jgi:hypothetical protein
MSRFARITEDPEYDLDEDWEDAYVIKEFSEWSPQAQKRLVDDVFGEDCSPFNTVNS